jgi:hypothetical protein
VDRSSTDWDNKPLVPDQNAIQHADSAIAARERREGTMLFHMLQLIEAEAADAIAPSMHALDLRHCLLSATPSRAGNYTTWPVMARTSQ